MTAAAISIDEDLRITVPHLLQTGTIATHVGARSGAIATHVGARLWEDLETW